MGKQAALILVLCLAVALPLWLLSALARPGTVIEGAAHVRDGDTIVDGGTPVHLNGLACPELNEAGGHAAKTLMERLTSGQIVTCTMNGEAPAIGKLGSAGSPASMSRPR